MSYLLVINSHSKKPLCIPLCDPGAGSCKLHFQTASWVSVHFSKKSHERQFGRPEKGERGLFSIFPCVAGISVRRSHK